MDGAMPVKKLIISLVSLFLCTINASHAAVEAFGVQPGTSIEKLEVINHVKPYEVQIRPPLPVSYFSNYFVFFSPSEGVCSITAKSVKRMAGRNLSSAVYSLRELIGKLSEKYGPANTETQLLNELNRRRSSEVIERFYRGESFAVISWVDFSGNGSLLPEGLSSIDVRLNPHNEDQYILGIRYSFENYGKCLDEIQGLDLDRL